MGFSPEKGFEILGNITNGLTMLGVPNPKQFLEEYIILKKEVSELKAQVAKLTKQQAKLKKLIKTLQVDDEDDD